MKTGRCHWVALVLLFVAPAPVFAQSSIEARVKVLEDAIYELERRVSSLEARLAETSAAAPARGAPDLANWRKLRRGMSEDEVERLLGAPSKVEAHELYINWYYGERPFGGSVEFDGRSGKVTGWTEP